MQPPRFLRRQISIVPQQYAALGERAFATGNSINSLIRDAIHEYLENLHHPGVNNHSPQSERPNPPAESIAAKPAKMKARRRKEEMYIIQPVEGGVDRPMPVPFDKAHRLWKKIGAEMENPNSKYIKDYKLFMANAGPACGLTELEAWELDACFQTDETLRERMEEMDHA